MNALSSIVMPLASSSIVYPTMNPTISIFPDKLAMAEYMLELIVSSAETSIADHGIFSIALSGGGTPQPLYELLAEPENARRIDWAHTHLFWGDERCVPSDADGSNYKQAWDAFISRIAIPDENVHRVRTEFECEIAAHDYMRQMEQFALSNQPSDGPMWPIFDLVLLGMGSDGHTASLFPGTRQARDVPVKVIQADYAGRPANRVTLTEAVFNDARRIFVLIAGAGKAEMVQTVLGDDVDLEHYPIQRIRPKNGQLTFMLDAPAAHLTNI